MGTQYSQLEGREMGEKYFPILFVAFASHKIVQNIPSQITVIQTRTDWISFVNHQWNWNLLRLLYSALDACHCHQGRNMDANRTAAVPLRVMAINPWWLNYCPVSLYVRPRRTRHYRQGLCDAPHNSEGKFWNLFPVMVCRRSEWLTDGIVLDGLLKSDLDKMKDKHRYGSPQITVT